VRNRAVHLAGLALALGLLAGCEARQATAPVDSAAAPAALIKLAVPAAAGAGQPRLTRTIDGRPLISWQETVGAESTLRYAVLEGDDWTVGHTVAEGADWFVNWADFPSVQPISDSLWAAHWLQKRPGGPYAYDVALALSLDGGVTWSETITPHDDDTPTEHGFVSLFAHSGGVAALWLDGRETLPAAGHHDHGAGGGGMTLRSAVIAADGSVRDPVVVDDLVCDCCPTDVAISSSGPVAVYRNRTEEEIRDIHIARFVDGTWQAGVRIGDDGWEVRGCPVNGPAIAASGPQLAVAWFTGAQGRSRVMFARSADGGDTFSVPIEIDTGAVLGRVDVEWLDEGSAVVSWLRDTGDGNADALVRRIDAAGAAQQETVVAVVSAATATGFPQMLRHGDRLIFAWTEGARGNTRLASGWLAIPTL